MEEMYAASCMCMWRKDDIFRQRRLSIHHVLYIVHYISCIILMHHALVSCIQKFVNPSLHLLKRMVLKTICSCWSHIQRLHYPAFAAFFYCVPKGLQVLACWRRKVLYKYQDYMGTIYCTALLFCNGQTA